MSFTLLSLIAKRATWLSRLALLIPLMAVTGCGFKLHNQNYLPKALHSLYLQTPSPYNAFTKQLEQTLQGNGVMLASDQKATDITLQILDEATTHQPIGISGSNQLSLVLLNYSLTYQLINAQGQVIIPAKTITAKRNLTVASNQMLGTSNEQALLMQELYRDVIAQLLNQLSAADTQTALAKS